MNRDLEIKLMDCLTALEEGGALEEILARYPQDAAALRPHLQTALALARLGASPSPAARSRSKAAFLAAAQDLQNRPRPLPWFRDFPALNALAIVLMVMGFGALLLITAEAALPGSALYGLKLAGEDIRLRLAPDAASRDALTTQFEQERLDEIRALIAAGRAERVVFQGEVESIDPDRWMVAGIPVVVEQSTIISGPPVAGAQARVTGQTSRDGVRALEIIIESADEPIIPPAPTETREAPRTPAPTTTATWTPSPTPSPSVPPAPTATPSPPPVAPTTPAPDDNDNEDDEEEDDDSDSEDDDDD